MFEKIVEFEDNLQNKFMPTQPRNIQLPDSEINEKYLKGDVRILEDIVGDNHNEELPEIKIGYSKISDLAKKVGSEYFDKLKM